MTPDLIINARARDFLTAEFKNIGQKLDQLGTRGARSMGALNKQASGLSKSLQDAGNFLKGYLTLAAARGLVRQVKELADLGDQYGKLSTRLRLSAEFLSEVGFAADRAGVDFATFAKSLETAQKNLGQFRATGSGEAKDALAVLGEDIKQAVQEGQSLEQLLPRISQRLNTMADQEKRIFAVRGIFGRGGGGLAQFFAEGGDLEALRARARELGAAFTDEQAKSYERLADSITDLETAWRGLKIAALDAFGPELQERIQQVTQLLIDIREHGIGAVSLQSFRTLAIDAIWQALKNSPAGLMLQYNPAIYGLRNFLGGGGGATTPAAAGDPNDVFRGGPFTTPLPLDPTARGLIGDRRPVFQPEAIELLDYTRSTFQSKFSDQAMDIRTRELDAQAEAYERIRDVRRELAEQEERENPLAGLRSAFDESAQAAREWGLATKSAVLDVQQAIAGGLTDAILDYQQGLIDSREFSRRATVGILQDIQRIIVQTLILKAVQGLFGSFAGGGGRQTSGGGGGFIGGTQSSYTYRINGAGGVFGDPVVAGLQRGGVVTRRGVFDLASGGRALIGEAGHAEAVVPLPDNRRIPVMLLGQRPTAGGGSVRNYNTTVVLSDGSRADPQLEQRVKAAVLRAMREDRAFRESMVA